MIKAIIFDIDGTLIDSNDFHALAWEKVFAAHGKSISSQTIRPHLGKGADQLLPEFLNAQEIEKFGEAMSRERSEIFKRDYLPKVRPFPKVRELFKAIRESDVRIALASSSKEDEVEEYKVIAEIGDLVETSTSADDARQSKPEPDIFQAAMKRLGDPAAADVLIVGDTPYDAIAATKAKLRVIGVLCGGFPESVLRSNGCRAVYQDPADMLAKLDQILNG